MKIDSIQVSNFRGIKHASLPNLGSMIVIAGANGSGKSCIFDAIRLIKSIYGGYQQNEWHHWMNEFQIQFANRAANFSSLLNDKNKQMIISISFRLHPNEREFLRQNGKELVRQSIWRVIAPELYGWSDFRAAPMAAQLRAREPEVNQQTEIQFEQLVHELSADTLTAQLRILGPSLQVAPSKALELIFGTFLPQELGVIDYHGPQRFFSRELVQGINLNLEAQQQQQSQSALYNYSNKYANVKSEMAAAYVKEIIAEQAGVPKVAQSTLNNTLVELFQTFFPDKQFLGPQPRLDGSLDFPVRTNDGSVHDLNDLSAGEKEILFGYLRIRNSAPRYSIILIDEPELHLNPRLVRGLPQFYNAHLGIAHDNQIWLVTHSDAILREVVGRHEYSLFHMEPGNSSTIESQAKPMVAEEEIERAVIDLVGDLAAYRPGGKVVVFEGGGDLEFDQQMTGTLFPEFEKKTNFISGGNKLRVRHLHEVLQKASAKGNLPFKIYSICDRDSSSEQPPMATAFTWDVYHIENYLLESEYVLKALETLGIRKLNDSASVYEAMREIARLTLPDLIRHGISERSNRALISAIDTKTSPNATDVSAALHEAVKRSANRISSAIEGPLSLENLRKEEEKLRAEFSYQLSGDDWRKTFRGRDILRRFAGAFAEKVPYESFRNVIISKMRDANFRPTGMKSVISKIVADN